VGRGGNGRAIRAVARARRPARAWAAHSIARIAFRRTVAAHPEENDVLLAGPPANSTVPEPSTYALFVTGLLALGGVARRKKK
jgi:hypothetical protein